MLQSKLQVPLTIDEARAIFRKYGHDAKGRLPYDLFCRRLFTSSAHVMALQGSRSKPYDAADKSSWSHQAMVRPSLIPSLCTHFTRAGIEWRR